MMENKNLSAKSAPAWRPLVRASLDFAIDDYDSVLEVCKKWIANTYERCLRHPISSQLLNLQNNDFRPPGLCFAWLTLDHPADGVVKIFSAKIEHPDQRLPRTWSIEFEIAITAEKVVFGIRNAVFGQDILSAPQSIPRLVKDLS
ncbi:hypothetical protein LP420_34045 [Massilia sp. B-10]|nr:hypothetical protein LP420_34045 [Massilia sp. B-10]UUZ53602.1 hypothetical protein LP419_33530 [Massilia sp. H-1]